MVKMIYLHLYDNDEEKLLNVEAECAITGLCECVREAEKAQKKTQRKQLYTGSIPPKFAIIGNGLEPQTAASSSIQEPNYWAMLWQEPSYEATTTVSQGLHCQETRDRTWGWEPNPSTTKWDVSVLTRG